MKNEKVLVCMYNFLPYNDASGNIVAKKIYNNKKEVDVIHNNLEKTTDNEFYEIIKEYIDEDILLDTPYMFGYWKALKQFIHEGLNAIINITNIMVNILRFIVELCFLFLIF
ncbi:hypothetical protein [Methanosphaera sp.]